MGSFRFGYFKKQVDLISESRLAKEQYIQDNLAHRDDIVKKWYEVGGDLFYDWAKKHYKIYTGESLRWNDIFLKDFYRFIGEPRIKDGYIEKGSQVGYTEALIAFCAFFLAYLKLPIGFGFEEWKKQCAIVSTRLQLSFSHCQPIQDLNERQLKLVKRKDTDTKNNITVAGVQATFFYAGTKNDKSPTAEISRQASSRLSSFPAMAILADEVELWVDGVLDVSRRRMDASILPNQILRAGSTPGHEGGLVDVAVRSSNYIFQWHINCPHCGELQPLDPFDNFLKAKEVEDAGQIVSKYLDNAGRPLDWFYKDPHNRRDSAYVGCKFCETELTREVIRTGFYRCIKTGTTIDDFFHTLRSKENTIVERAAIRLPKLATDRFSPCAMINELFDTQNPADAIQQGLGKPFSLGNGKIQLEVLLECVGLQLPPSLQDKPFDIVTLGFDQGKYTNYAIIAGWHLGDDPSKEMKWKKAHKSILWWGNVDTFEDLDPLIEEYNVLLVGSDSEPEWSVAANYCYKHPPMGRTVISLEGFAHTGNQSTDSYSIRGPQGGILSGLRRGTDDESYWSQYTKGMSVLGQVYLFDQVNLNKTQYKRHMKQIKAHESKLIPIFSIDRTFWLDAVRDRIYARHSHYPADLKYNPKDKNNLLYQYLTSDRLVSERRWVENGPDHYFHADNFGEAALFLSMFDY